jgi:hypothetical protein
MADNTGESYRLMNNKAGSDDMFSLNWGGDAGACWEIW